jgi:hypothetical protein
VEQQKNQRYFTVDQRSKTNDEVNSKQDVCHFISNSIDPLAQQAKGCRTSQNI